MAHISVYTGTLTEITARYGKELAGKRLRVTVDQTPQRSVQVEKYFWETATPEQWVEAFEEWARGHDASSQPLSDEAVDRESIYEGRGD